MVEYIFKPENDSSSLTSGIGDILPPIYMYNHNYEGEGKWVFIKEVDE